MTDSLLDGSQTDETIDVKDYIPGEGKKFKDIETLAEAKARSDLYIKQMERSNDELRSDYLKLKEQADAGPQLKDLMDQLRNQQRDSNTPASDVQNLPTVDPKLIEDLVDSKLQQADQLRIQRQNSNIVKEKLIERYGPNYQTAFKQQIERLGLEPSFVDDLARKHPTVLFKTFGLDTPVQTEGFQAPPRSDMRRDSFAPTNDKRSWSYYQKMRKDDPVRYHNPKTQVQMHTDAIELGAAFEDGDWKALG